MYVTHTQPLIAVGPPTAPNESQGSPRTRQNEALRIHFSTAKFFRICVKKDECGPDQVPLWQHDTLPILPLSFPLDIDKSTLTALVTLVISILKMWAPCQAAEKSIFCHALFCHAPKIKKIGLGA